MGEWLATRPGPLDHVPYFGRYIERVPDGNIIETLRDRIATTARFFGGLEESKGDHRYAPGKWTVKEVLGHLIDGERVFSYRALRFARGDGTALPGFDENVYVPAGAFGRRSLADLVGEFRSVRASTVALFAGLPEEAWGRRGSASGVEVSVRALPWIIAGHEIHHVEVVGERYL
ncbi:MAG: DinB family protein [Candidatus Eisenbacteria bacterium]